MKSLKLAYIIDFIFINFLIFLIIFTWARFFTKSILLSFFIAIVCSGIFVFFKIFVYKSNKLNISTNLQKDINNYILSLLSNTKKENLDYVKECLKTDYLKTDEDKNLIFTNFKTVYCPVFFENTLTLPTALKHIKFAITDNNKKIIFLCNEVSENQKTMLCNIDNIDVEILDKNNIFQKFFLLYQQYPKILFDRKKQKKINLKQLINVSFNKSRSKKYFLSGLFVLFCSLFVKLNFYYVFLSTLLFESINLTLK